MRDRITARARALFASEGYESVSIRRLMGEVGLSPMMFYQFFPHKRALLRHIWDDIFADLFHACETAMENEESATEKLTSFLKEALRYWLNNPESYRVVYMYEDRVENEDDVMYGGSDLLRERLALLNELIREGMENGEFREMEPDLTLQSAIVLLHGLAQSLITIPEFPWRDTEALADHAIGLFMRGLKR